MAYLLVIINVKTVKGSSTLSDAFSKALIELNQCKLSRP